jgi:hypothetical protein
MYQNLGVQWASSIPAFLALACAPMPFLFYRFGKYLRERSKLATEARMVMEDIFEGHKADRTLGKGQNQRARHEHQVTAGILDGKVEATEIGEEMKTTTLDSEFTVIQR